MEAFQWQISMQDHDTWVKPKNLTLSGFLSETKCGLKWKKRIHTHQQQRTVQHATHTPAHAHTCTLILLCLFSFSWVFGGYVNRNLFRTWCLSRCHGRSTMSLTVGKEVVQRRWNSSLFLNLHVTELLNFFCHGLISPGTYGSHVSPFN